MTGLILSLIRRLRGPGPPAPDPSFYPVTTAADLRDLDYGTPPGLIVAIPRSMEAAMRAHPRFKPCLPDLSRPPEGVVTGPASIFDRRIGTIGESPVWVKPMPDAPDPRLDVGPPDRKPTRDPHIFSAWVAGESTHWSASREAGPDGPARPERHWTEFWEQRECRSCRKVERRNHRVHECWEGPAAEPD